MKIKKGKRGDSEDNEDEYWNIKILIFFKLTNILLF